MLPYDPVAYRDDRQALALQVAQLERENERLRERLDQAKDRYRELENDRHNERRVGTRIACVLCGGTLLPVAVFAGHDIRSPIPLSMSTLRFGLPDGGFTHSAPVHSMACSSCGYIHNFIDMDRAGRPVGVAIEHTDQESPGDEAEANDGVDPDSPADVT